MAWCEHGGVHLDAAIDSFSTYLSAERGFSAHTVRSYRSDLLSLAGFADRAGVAGTAGLSLELLRDWLWQGSQAGLAKSTLARRSAAARALTSWLAASGETEADAAVREASVNSSAFFSTSSMPPHRKKACSGMWS